jgi:hypothetical protein
MMVVLPEIYQQALDYSMDHKVPLFQAERKIVGFDHSQVGHLVAAKWKLNVPMKCAIAGHHRIEHRDESLNLLMGSMSLANQTTIYFKIGAGGDACVDLLLMQSLADRCGIGLEDLFALKDHIETEIEKARVFLRNNSKGSSHAH